MNCKDTILFQIIYDITEFLFEKAGGMCLDDLIGSLLGGWKFYRGSGNRDDDVFFDIEFFLNAGVDSDEKMRKVRSVGIENLIEWKTDYECNEVCGIEKVYFKKQ